MPSHAMARNTHALGVDLGEMPKHELRQFARDVAGHAVAIGPGFVGGVDVEAGAGAEVPVFVFVWEVETACREKRGEEE